MTTTEIETVPTAWTTEDERFFRSVNGLFDGAFLFGSGVLLASYDLDETQPELASPPMPTASLARTFRSPAVAA